MGLYFSRLFLRDRYSVARDKFGQKQLSGVLSGSLKIASRVIISQKCCVRVLNKPLKWIDQSDNVLFVGFFYKSLI